MADKYKAGDQIKGFGDKAPLFTDENGDLYSKTSGGGRKYAGIKIDLETGYTTTKGDVRTDSMSPGQVKQAEDAPTFEEVNGPKGKLDGVITHDDVAAIPKGAKATVTAAGKIVYDGTGSDGKKRQYEVAGVYVDTWTGKTYKDKAEYEAAKVKSDAAKKKATVKLQSNLDKSPDVKVVAPDAALTKKQVAEWQANLPTFLTPSETSQYQAAATSGLSDNAKALQGIAVLVGTVRKGTPAPLPPAAAKVKSSGRQDEEMATGSQGLGGVGSQIKGSIGFDPIKSTVEYPNGFMDVPVLAGGDEMLYKLKASAVGNPTLYAKTVQSLIDAGYLDPKFQSDKVTKAVLDAYTQALTEYGDTYQYGNKDKSQMKVTFGDFLSSTAQYNKDHGIGPAGEPAKQAPVRVDTFTDEAGVRAAARNAFQQATGKIDDSLVDSFVANFRGLEQTYNDQRYQAQLADAGMGGDPNAATGLAAPDVSGQLDTVLNDNPELKAAKQSMDTGDYLRKLFEVVGGPSL